MELHLPLILFTTFVAWSTGLFGTQGIASLVDEGKKAQIPALITSMVLLTIGGISVFLHLKHWERIFNGFGNPTSGITQELVCIIILVVIAVVVFVFARKAADDEPVIPKWLAVVMIAASILLVCVTGHSYMMEARPAWNSFAGILSLVGTAAVLGPVSFAIIEAIVGESVEKTIAKSALVGSVINIVTTVCYIISMAMSVSEYSDVGYYFDPTSPTNPMADIAAYTPFAADSVIMTAVAVAGAFIALVAVVMGKKSGNWKLWGIVSAVAAVLGAICLRVIFYQMGASVYLFY